jgi:DNA-binding CsgD family transcriptional regulator
VLAAAGDRRAPQAVEEARRLGVAASHLNRAMIGYAEAVLAGRRGDKRSAQELVAVADRGWTNCEAWADLARVLAAPAALDGGWADATTWLTSASMGFSERGLPAMREQCRQLQAEASLNPWTSLGVTDREADVLRLVANGRANKEIAAELRLSPRTVEKHVESLLRKSGSRSRTELVARLAAGTASARAPGSPTTT